MYKIDDAVIYGTDGICKIVDIAQRCFNGTEQEYYILKPLTKNGSTIMIPTKNEMLVSRMRKLLTADEVNALIESIPSEQGLDWVDDDKQRKETYRRVLLHGDRSELIRLIKVIYEHGESQKKIGKKLHACDERFLSDAEKLLYDEFSLVLGIQREQILDYITERANLEPKQA